MALADVPSAATELDTPGRRRGSRIGSVPCYSWHNEISVAAQVFLSGPLVPSLRGQTRAADLPLTEPAGTKRVRRPVRGLARLSGRTAPGTIRRPSAVRARSRFIQPRHPATHVSAQPGRSAFPQPSGTERKLRSAGTSCRTSPSGCKDQSHPSPGRLQPLFCGRPYVPS